MLHDLQNYDRRVGSVALPVNRKNSFQVEAKRAVSGRNIQGGFHKKPRGDIVQVVCPGSRDRGRGTGVKNNERLACGRLRVVLAASRGFSSFKPVRGRLILFPITAEMPGSTSK